MPEEAGPPPFDWLAYARRLYDSGCVRFGAFTHLDGGEFPVYVDAAGLCADVDLLEDTARVLAANCKGRSAQWLAALNGPAIPIVTAVALQLRLPFCVVTPRDGFQGARRMVDPIPPEGSRLLLIDLVCGPGRALTRAVDVLVFARPEMIGAVALMDFGLGGGQMLANWSVPFSAAYDIRHLVRDIHDAGCITNERYSEVMGKLKGEFDGA